MRKRVVVIGGGIAGCSVALHLARAGWQDVLLIEKGELTSGSTHHAAGLVTQFNPSSTMMRLRRYSVALYRELQVFETVGSVRIASERGELARPAARGEPRRRGGLRGGARSLPTRSSSGCPRRTAPRSSAASGCPDDGWVDPHIATYAVADAARALGVEIRIRARVTGIELGPGREVRAVVTDQGRIETEHVVNAAGIWAPQVAAMVGAFLPSIPVDHQHVTMQAVAGHEIPRDAPCFRDTDNLVYGKAEAGGLLVGGYEPNPTARWADGVPWDHGASPVESDMDRFAPLLEGAIRRFPMLEESGVVRLLCHPDAMTPDGNPLLGPMPGVRGFWVAAGLSLNGFGGAGGLGRSLAEWMTEGETEIDVDAYRAWRFGGVYRDTVVQAETAREAYKYYYRLRYPLDTAQAGRGRRLSPLHGRLEELGAVFGVKNGWERADYFAPGRPWRRAGEDQRAFGWTRPPYFDLLAEEHAAFRERVGIIDLSSFGKIAVRGPRRARAARARQRQPDGSAGRSRDLHAVPQPGRGDRRRPHRHAACLGRVPGRDRGRRHRLGPGVAAAEPRSSRRPRGDRGRVRARRLSSGSGVRRRAEVLMEVTDDDLSNEAIPFSTAREIAIAGAPVLAQRITFVGELGFELYVRARVGRAGLGSDLGRGRGARHPRRWLPGARVAADREGLSLLRQRPHARGYAIRRRRGVLRRRGQAVHRRRGARPARAQGPRHRVRTLLVGDDATYLALYGGEAVRLDGHVVGRVRSCAYAHTIRRNVALAQLPADLDVGARVDVEVLGEPVPAEIVATVLHDPENARIHDLAGIADRPPPPTTHPR